MVKVKICGITNLKDALAAVEFGADALGFVFYTNSPRAVTLETVKSIVSELPPFITTIGVFVDEHKGKLEKIARDARLHTVQLHGSEPPEACQLCIKTIKAVRVRDLTDLESLRGYSVSAFLLDTYSPHALGGTGRIFNWEIAVEAKRLGKIILAGGLTSENIDDAIKIVQPYGVDVSSGVESSKGIKDHKKLRSFIEKARNASLKYSL
ncbi:MAG: phosphoribosylanthranilate isomerase [Nitrospiraceae bacterium]|nr:MAG: phosphoribosylanthranilate isomerase [Nitrospiraceae bacterium]